MVQYSRTGVYAYISTPAGTTCTNGGEFYRLEGTFTNEVLEGFSIPVNKITYDGEKKLFEVNLHLTLSSDTNNPIITIGLYKSGSLEVNSQMTTKINQTTDRKILSLVDAILLENGDDIEIRIASSIGGAVITAQTGTASLTPFF